MRRATGSGLLFLTLGFITVLSCGKRASLPKFPDGQTYETRAQLAIVKAVDFLNRHESIDLPLVFVSEFIKKRFNGTQLKKFPRPKARSSEIVYFSRLVDAGYRPPKNAIAAVRNPIDNFTLSALYCDRQGLPDDFFQRAEQLMDGRGYALTHAALGTKWAHELGCLNAALAAKLMAKERALLARVGAENEMPSDLAIEALAMLYYLDAPELVKQEDLENLIATQHTLGAWQPKSDVFELNNHTTILALWVLLESLNRKKVLSPWLQKD